MNSSEISARKDYINILLSSIQDDSTFATLKKYEHKPPYSYSLLKIFRRVFSNPIAKLLELYSTGSTHSYDHTNRNLKGLLEDLVENGTPQELKYLLEHTSNILAHDSSGNTMMHILLKYIKPNLEEVLLYWIFKHPTKEIKEMIAEKNDEYESPFYFAKRNASCQKIVCELTPVIGYSTSAEVYYYANVMRVAKYVSDKFDDEEYDDAIADLLSPFLDKRSKKVIFDELMSELKMSRAINFYVIADLNLPHVNLFLNDKMMSIYVASIDGSAPLIVNALITKVGLENVYSLVRGDHRKDTLRIVNSRHSTPSLQVDVKEGMVDASLFIPYGNTLSSVMLALLIANEFGKMTVEEAEKFFKKISYPTAELALNPESLPFLAPVFKILSQNDEEGVWLQLQEEAYKEHAKNAFALDVDELVVRFAQYTGIKHMCPQWEDASRATLALIDEEMYTNDFSYELVNKALSESDLFRVLKLISDVDSDESFEKLKNTPLVGIMDGQANNIMHMILSTPAIWQNPRVMDWILMQPLDEVIALMYKKNSEGIVPYDELLSYIQYSHSYKDLELLFSTPLKQPFTFNLFSVVNDIFPGSAKRIFDLYHTVNLLDKNGKSLLELAAHYASDIDVFYILNKDINRHQVDNKHNNVLHIIFSYSIAQQYSFISTWILMLPPEEIAALLAEKNDAGEMPLEIAMHNPIHVDLVMKLVRIPGVVVNQEAYQAYVDENQGAKPWVFASPPTHNLFSSHYSYSEKTELYKQLPNAPQRSLLPLIGKYIKRERDIKANLRKDLKPINTKLFFNMPMFRDYVLSRAEQLTGFAVINGIIRAWQNGEHSIAVYAIIHPDKKIDILYIDSLAKHYDILKDITAGTGGRLLYLNEPIQRDKVSCRLIAQEVSVKLSRFSPEQALDFFDELFKKSHEEKLRLQDFPVWLGLIAMCQNVSLVIDLKLEIEQELNTPVNHRQETLGDILSRVLNQPQAPTQNIRLSQKDKKYYKRGELAFELSDDELIERVADILGIKDMCPDWKKVTDLTLANMGTWVSGLGFRYHYMNLIVSSPATQVQKPLKPC